MMAVIGALDTWLAGAAASIDLGPPLEPYSERVLEKEVMIRADLDSVWDAWTTEDGSGAAGERRGRGC